MDKISFLQKLGLQDPVKDLIIAYGGVDKVRKSRLKFGDHTLGSWFRREILGKLTDRQIKEMDAMKP